LQPVGSVSPEDTRLTEAKAAVAVVVPVFNRLSLLRDTVESLCAQSLADAQFILVDDRSGEETGSFLDSLTDRDPRFTIVRKPDSLPRGAQSSRNLGLDVARAESVVFLDSDDLLAPRCLEERVALLRGDRNADIIVGRQAVIGPGSALTWVNVRRPEVPWLDRFLECAGEVDVPWINGGALIRKERLGSLGIRWRPEFHWDDIVFHIECLSAGMNVAVTPPRAAPDSFYRSHDDERYGQVLSTPAGIENAGRMFVWLHDLLASQGRMTEHRRMTLNRSFFHFCIQQSVDLGERPLAFQLFDQARSTGLLSAANSRRIRAYLATAGIHRISHRLAASSLRVARSTWLRPFFDSRRSTFANIPVAS
jgi:glycosyltransferase involved in cell wall biosynthesis